MLLRSVLAAPAFEQAGYSTVASIDLAPLMDLSPKAVAVDADGNTYVLGGTENAPSGAQRIGVGGQADMIITKISPAGQVIYNTVIGGGSADYGNAIRVDSLGHVVVGGITFSTNFPLRNAAQLTPGNGHTWFVCRLAPDGASLVYSTYYGTGSDDAFAGMAVTPNGEAILAGHTRSTHFPVTSNAVQKLLGVNPNTFASDAVIVRLGAYGSNVIFSTYLGGMSGDEATGVVLDATGATWVVGNTMSPDFPVTSDAAQALPRIPESGYGFVSDVFFVKLGNDGSLLYSTFSGTEIYESVTAVSFAPNGSMLLAWRTAPLFGIPGRPRGPADAPFQPPLPPSNPQQDAFVAALNPQTGQVLSQGRLAGLGYHSIRNVAGDSQGNIHVLGDLPNGSFLAQFEPGQSRPARFAAFHHCPYSLLNGLAVGPANELLITIATWNESSMADEVFLRKLTPSLPAPINHAPIVSLGSYGPSTPAFRNDPGSLLISPVALDMDGVIQHVQLFSGATLLAALTNAPYTFAWTNPPFGEHIVRAVATDNGGLSATSCPTIFSLPPPPENDSFYRSKIVFGATFTVAGTTAGATADSQEPHRGPPVPDMAFDPWADSPSVWWCWRAPHSGTFSVGISNWFHNVTVFTGRDFAHLTHLGYGQAVAFQANTGTAYYIRVSGPNAEYVLSLAPAVPPPNDNFADGALISGAPLSLVANNFNATFEPELPAGDLFGSVWWTWTASEEGIYRFLTISTNAFGLKLAVLPTQSFGNSYTSVVSSATNGQQFHIRVADAPTQFELRVDRLSTPPNDNFADAIVLGDLPVSTSGSLLGAGTEINEPYYPYPSGVGSSVWYKWTAPQSMSVILEVSSDNRGAVLGVYTGSTLEDLMQEVRTYGGDTPVQLSATGGRDYWIVLDSSWGGTGDFTLSLRSLNYPPNDDFDQRIAVTEGAFGSNAEATIEPIDEPLNGDSESIWYSWVAPATGDFTLVIHNYGFYGRAAVYTLGEFDNLVTVAHHTNASSRFLRFSAVAGTDYEIAFISQQGGGGPLAFRIRPSSPPVNDQFQDATQLTDANAIVEGSNIDATLEAGESTHFGQASASVWWTWTPPSSGQFVVSIPRSTFSADFTVYRGTRVSNLTVAPPTYNLPGSALLDAVAGEQYRISVFSLYNQQGEFTLTITPIIRPENDDFANAAPLHSSTASATGTTLGATAESGETTPSVWWSWTASVSGEISVKLTLARPLEVFTGSSLGTLSRIAMSSNSYSAAAVTFEAQAAASYYIRVSGYAFTPFTLSLNGPMPIEQPALTAVSHQPDGSIQFIFDGLIGTTNVVEASTDLENWLPISTNLTDCYPYPFTAPHSGNSYQFYRVRLTR